MAAAQPRTGARPARGDLTRQAVRSALKTRRQLDIPFDEAVCTYDVADRLDIELRFVDIPTLEGMYVRPNAKTRPLILVSSLRPPGRQASTAAHELGHHIFGHGTRVDLYVASVSDSLAHPTGADPDELLASTFAGFFLMPKPAVERGFRERKFAIESVTARDVFTVAGWLGVGYGTLIHHMRSSLRVLTAARAQQLLAIPPKRIREEILGRATPANVVIVDAAWTGRPVDLQVGDIALVPGGTVIESNATPMAVTGAQTLPTGQQVVQAITPGLARLCGADWSAFARVSRRGYLGRNVFRHLELAEDDDVVTPASDTSEVD